jgi:hypothetical protein
MLLGTSIGAQPLKPTTTPLVRTVDLNLGESQVVTLHDGSKATVKLVDVDEIRDSVRSAVRTAQVHVEVNGRPTTLTCGNYHLPVSIAGAQIDCTITKGYYRDTNSDRWGLVKDARLRLWPAGSPYIAPETFVYPLKQRWFASATQMANEPVYVDGGEPVGRKRTYYHSGLDFGGAEGLAEVVSATDGMVVARGLDILDGYEGTPVYRLKPRSDVVYVFDIRGWSYRYSHLHSIDPGVRLGQKIQKGQTIGLLGKEGGSGGWAHLHFEIKSLQPSGKWGTQAGYAFIWEAYLRQRQPKLIAVSRPHHLAWIGEKVVLDATRSWGSSGDSLHYEWRFTDGTSAQGEKVERIYDKPGSYSEILRVTDEKGQVDYDFALVYVRNREKPELVPPAIHACFHPSLGLHPGDEVTFKVRTFNTTHGRETLDFGDGSDKVTVQSDGNVHMHNPNGYAITTHRYREPGDYIVEVTRANEHGQKAVMHLHVRVNAKR